MVWNLIFSVAFSLLTHFLCVMSQGLESCLKGPDNYNSQVLIEATVIALTKLQPLLSKVCNHVDVPKTYSRTACLLNIFQMNNVFLDVISLFWDEWSLGVKIKGNFIYSWHSPCVFAGVSHAQSSVLGGSRCAAAGWSKLVLCRNRPAGAEPPHSRLNARLQRQGETRTNTQYTSQ